MNSTRISIALVLAMAMTAAFSTMARAEEKGDWRYRADLITAMPILGYEPATILSTGQEEPYDAGIAPERFFRFGGILAVEGAYAAFDLRPYTDVRNTDDKVRVRTGGLEAWLSAPFSKWLVPGFYHHSSHNFSDGDYGFGTNLNSLYLSIRMVDASAGLGGSPARFRLRTEAHVFFSRNASPHLLTDAARVPAGESGRTAWRGALLLDGWHRYVRTEASVTANGDEEGRPASVMADIPIAFCPGPALRTLGEHLSLGPYAAFGWNLSRTETFGETAWSAGIRLNISLADTMH